MNKYFEIKKIARGKDKGRFRWVLVNRGRVVARSAHAHRQRGDAARTCKGINPAVPIKA